MILDSPSNLSICGYSDKGMCPSMDISSNLAIYRPPDKGRCHPWISLEIWPSVNELTEVVGYILTPMDDL